MAATTTLDSFLDLLRKSGAIDPRRLDAFVGSKYGLSPPDANQIADDLIAAGYLTRYHTEPLLAGRSQRFVLSGKYRIIDRLGSGGMASVFLCEHKVMRRRVAVKMLPPSLSSNPSSLDRFHREARAMAGVHHPNIVGAHDVDQDGKIHFIVMEFVDGTNFHELVRRAGPLTVERAAHYIAQAARGLQHAHDKGLVHRDIKPANLLIDRHGTVKILDLGLALVFQGGEDNLTRDHDANSILGTAEYLAPEQAVDSHNVDHRADIYSLGMTMYFLLAAQTPFGEGTTAQKLIWHQLRQPKPIRDHRPDVPEEMWAVMAKLLAKDPAERYQKMNELIEALSPWTKSSIPPPADSEMPKPLEDLPADLPADNNPTQIGYPSANNAAAAALPTPFDDAPPAGRSAGTNGSHKAKGGSEAPAAFALPGGLEAAIPTPPVAAAPTAPNRTVGPGSAAVIPSRPSAAPASSKVAVPLGAPPSAKTSPVGGSSVVRKGAPSSIKKSVVLSEDDDEGGKPKSKKFKKKADQKGNSTVLMAVVGGLFVALLGVGGLVFALSGGDEKDPTLSEYAGPPPQPNPSPNPPPGPGPRPPGPAPVPVAPPLPNVAVGGKATASSDYRDAQYTETVDRAFDNNPRTKWYAGRPTGWIQYEFPDNKAFIIQQYRLQSAIDLERRNPKDWELQGSNDEKEWKLLDTRRNERFAGANATNTYELPNNKTAYRFIRLNVTAHNGGEGPQLAELFLGSNQPSVTIGAPPTAPPTPGQFLAKLEAENPQHATIINGRAVDDRAASGGRRVGYLTQADSGVEFNYKAPVAGGYVLKFGFSNGNAGPAFMVLTVNGSVVKVMSFPSTGVGQAAWSVFQTVEQPVNLVAGPNAIRLTKQGGSNPDIDYLDISASVETGPIVILPEIDADYFPTKTIPYYYESALNLATAAAMNPRAPARKIDVPWQIVRQKWDFKRNNQVTDIAVSAIQSGFAKALDAPQERVQVAPRPEVVENYRIRTEADLILLEPIKDNRPNGPAEPVLKVGAKKGDTWNKVLQNGDLQEFQLTELAEYEGKMFAVVLTHTFLPPPQRGADPIPLHITYTFVKGFGLAHRAMTVDIKDKMGNVETREYQVLKEYNMLQSR